MDAGKLNKKITIQKINKNGSLKDDTYIDYKTVWASITNLHGKEYLEAQKINPKISKKVSIRYIKELDSSLNIDVSKEYRVDYKGNFYNISYTDNIKEENRFIELMLEAD